MLLTSDGELCQRVLHPDYFHEKTYRVEVDREISDEFCLNMAQGVAYGEVVTKPCQVESLGESDCYWRKPAPGTGYQWGRRYAQYLSVNEAFRESR